MLARCPGLTYGKDQQGRQTQAAHKLHLILSYPNSQMSMAIDRESYAPVKMEVKEGGQGGCTGNDRSEECRTKNNECADWVCKVPRKSPGGILWLKRGC